MHILSNYGTDIIGSASSLVTYITIGMPIYYVEHTEDIGLDFYAIKTDPAFIDYFGKVFVFGLGLYHSFVVGGDDACACSLPGFFFVELTEVETPIFGEEISEVSILFGQYTVLSDE